MLSSDLVLFVLCCLVSIRLVHLCVRLSWVDWVQTTKLLTYLLLYHDGFSASLRGVLVCKVRPLSTSVSSTLFVLCVTDVVNAMQWSVTLLCDGWQMQLLQYSGLARSCFSVWQMWLLNTQRSVPGLCSLWLTLLLQYSVLHHLCVLRDWLGCDNILFRICVIHDRHGCCSAVFCPMLNTVQCSVPSLCSVWLLNGVLPHFCVVHDLHGNMAVTIQCSAPCPCSVWLLQ